MIHVYEIEAWGGAQVLEACGRRGEDAALALHEQGDTGFEPAAFESQLGTNKTVKAR